MRKAASPGASPIRAVIFDIGGVLYQEDIFLHQRLIIRKYRLDKARFDAARRKYIPDSSRGTMTGNAFLKAMARDVGVSPSQFRAFKRDWMRIRGDVMTLDRGVEGIVKRLKRTYVVGTLTNVIHLHHRVRLDLDAYRHFHPRIVSCNVGCRKPEKEIYLLLLRRLRMRASEVVFVDDYDKNMPPAKRLGMHTILFKNARQLERDLKSLGVVL